MLQLYQFGADLNKPLIAMIKLSRMADYGVVLMVNLARTPTRRRTAGEIAEATALPLPTVSKLLKQLAASGLLVSHRGAAGGYGLEREPGEISVAEIVAGDGGDYDVAEAHAAGGFGDALRFVGFEGVGLGGFDGAETAGAGAFFAGNHEGGGALAPAFPAVRALGLLANGHQFQVCDE